MHNMALSNWDTMAFDSNGKSCSGDFVFSNGTKISIYKNWIYLYDPTLWRDGDSFFKPCIGEVDSGNMDIAGIKIVAHRHSEQSAVFLYATRGRNETKQIFSGIGCSGYMNDLEIAKTFYPEEYAKITPQYLDKTKYDQSYYSQGFGAEETFEWGIYFWANDGTDSVKWPINAPHRIEYTGVTKETFQAFKTWLES